LNAFVCWAWWIYSIHLRVCDVLACFKLISNPFKRLVVVDHVFDYLFLVVSLVSWDELIESFNTSSHSNVSGITFDGAVLFLGSNQVLVIFDVSNWDGYVAVINGLSNS